MYMCNNSLPRRSVWTQSMLAKMTAQGRNADDPFVAALHRTERDPLDRRIRSGLILAEVIRSEADGVWWGTRPRSRGRS